MPFYFYFYSEILINIVLCLLIKFSQMIQTLLGGHHHSPTSLRDVGYVLDANFVIMVKSLLLFFIWNSHYFLNILNTNFLTLSHFHFNYSCNLTLIFFSVKHFLSLYLFPPLHSQ